MPGYELSATANPEDRPPSRRSWMDLYTLASVGLYLVSAAAAWFLLRELASLLRPLLLAVFLCYVILPIHLRLKQHIPSAASFAVLAVGSVGLLFLLVVMIYGSVIELNVDLPRLTRRALDLFAGVRDWSVAHLPWLAGVARDSASLETHGVDRIQNAAAALASVVADALVETLVVGFYLLFLLLEAAALPERIRSAFADERAQNILKVIQSINEAMANYLKVKVKASLLLAIPAAVVLAAFGVKFPVLWGVLTFLCNFIPYIGSVIACSLPLSLAFLQLEFGWQPLAVTILLVGVHMISAYLVEPSMTGKAVGLSPLVILTALAFWGQCWGLTGMLLAVPLTVMFKIVLDNVLLTRPFARMLAD